MTAFSNLAFFSISDTENLDPYCVNAREKDLAYLLSFDTDKLLAGFRETAGLDTKGATRYAGWESTLIGGHTMGHYLSAVSQGYASPGVSNEDKATLYKMITTLIDGLLECQKASKGRDNFLFGSVVLDPENVELQFDNVEKNQTNIITQAWVPWYTLHKLIAGVIDVYKLTAYEPALTVAKGIGDWSYARAMTWDEATAAQVLRIEYGGMNDALYELYAITGDDKYAIAAHYFDSIELFERVNSGSTDVLNNHHANTTIPKFIGALNRYVACHGKTIGGERLDASDYFEYSKSFWDMVVNKHTYVTGGNSEWEHFGRDYILDAERTNCNCETCNIYNMLKFSRTLFTLTGDVKYADYYENAFYNTILSSQNPETGMTTYFQPMSTGYFKVFGQRFDKFWCCTGTGMENFTKLGDSIFFHSDSHLIVNLYQSSHLVWREKNLDVKMKANLQKSDTVTIELTSLDGAPIKAGVALRLPPWLCDKPVITVRPASENSASASTKASSDASVNYTQGITFNTENSYAIIPAGLATGSIITIKLPMKVTASALPDNPRCIAFKYGPTVLSANLGTKDMITGTTGMMVTIPAGKISDYDDILLPEEISPEELICNPEKYLVMDCNIASSEFPTFTLTINGLSFAPHFARYKERYGIYFTVKTRQEYTEAKKAREEALKDKPEGIIIDTVQPGYGQYENDELHQMSDWGGSVGSTDNGTSRYAKSGGSFTYNMCVSVEDNNYLSITLLKADSGKTLKISSGDEVFYEDKLEYDGEDETYEIRIKLPMSIISGAREITANGEKHMVVPITFRGSQGAESARLFGFVYMMNY